METETQCVKIKTKVFAGRKKIIRSHVEFHFRFHQLGTQNEKGFALNYGKCESRICGNLAQKSSVRMQQLTRRVKEKFHP